MIRSLLLASAFSLIAMASAQAGAQYVDKSGFAIGGYDPVAYFDLAQSPVGQRQAPAVPGKASITAEYNGATWAFASEAHRDRFLADPAKYAPAYDGHCAYGIAQGGKVPGNPNLWRIVDGTLYLNITPTVVGFWEADIPDNLSKSRANWAELESKPASESSWKALDDNKGTYSGEAPITD
ncbi:YHS domain-containing (seleno)protein [Oceanibacterium hippocampi]|uniref:YHS domain protein n=1 Tax=Oceanibacterium hippocampi TaxID=745714 RepID=A0A1Y5TUI6_9PROT|nr:YHS domain-containing (seleno)protein [Oceanibacterium hippocampi]SLN73239.1 YHS domain protein [Oceanibacterium hippocampi]